MKLPHDAVNSSRIGARARALIVTPIKLYSDGIAHFLRGSDAVDVLGTATEGHTTIDLAIGLRPDVVVLDMSLPHSRETSRALRAALPRTAIVALGMPGSEGYVLDCAEAGMCGYVSRDGTLDDLVRAIVRIASGDEAVCSPPLAGGLLRRLAARAASDAAPEPVAAPGAPLLTRRQEIVALIDSGLTNKQIARELCIELPTVKNHVHAILERLGARTRGEAAAAIRRLSLAPSEYR
jgi:DNA-binding NarL/FixJ family response regulator